MGRDKFWNKCVLVVLLQVLIDVAIVKSQYLDANPGQCRWNYEKQICEINPQIILWGVGPMSKTRAYMQQCYQLFSPHNCLDLASYNVCEWTQNRCDVNQPFLQRFVEHCKEGLVLCPGDFVNYKKCSEQSFENCFSTDKERENEDDPFQFENYTNTERANIMYWALYKTDRSDVHNSDGNDLGLVPAIVVPVVIFILLFSGIFVCFVRKWLISLVRVERAINNNNANPNSNINQSQVGVVTQNSETSEIIDRLGVRKFELEKEDLICAICLEKFYEGEDVVKLNCAHQFHKVCIERWVKTKGFEVSCPLCNKNILG